DEPACAQSLQRVLVKNRSSRLPYHFAVPFQAVAAESFEDFLRRSGDDARRVEILYPHEPPPALPSREEPRSDGRDETAQMQRTGRRRSESADGAHRARFD